MAKKTIQFCFIAGVSIMLLGGCKTIKGGGWINSINGNGKATFGINLTCENSEYYGQFTFQDHGDKVEMADGKMRHVSLKAWVDHALLQAGDSCGDYHLEAYTEYNFAYRTQPDKSGEEGVGTIQFWDANRTEIPDDNDALCIQIFSGPYEGYMNCGDLGGGNLTIFDE